MTDLQNGSKEQVKKEYLEEARGDVAVALDLLIDDYLTTLKEFKHVASAGMLRIKPQEKD